MAASGIRREERTGLIAAVALHLLVLAGLVFQALQEPPPIIKPERMVVSLAEDVGLESTAPDPVPESAAAIAPTLSDAPAPTPEILEAPSEPVVERPTPKVNSPVPAPAPKPQPRREKPRETAKPQPKPKATEKGGGSAIGSDFLAGAGDSTTTSETRTPASQIGADATASLRQAINRQIKPHWSAPSGVDAEKLISVVSWRLDEEGRLSGSPTCKTLPESITESNRPQASLHCERALRAVRQAAPFDLPIKYYEGWKSIRAWTFDRRL
ncbi:energy transducer TonB [Qipengyuania sp. 483]